MVAAYFPPFWGYILLFGAALELNMVLSTIPNLFSHQNLNIFRRFLLFFCSLCTRFTREFSYKHAHRYFQVKIYYTLFLLLVFIDFGTSRDTKKRCTGPVFLQSGLSWPPLGPIWRPLGAILAATWCQQAAHKPSRAAMGRPNAS